jgi:predicted ArsR family transcriptional regulator
MMVANVPDEAVASPRVTDDPGAFTAVVAELSSSFGDPTRRAIYLFVRQHDGTTVSEVARAHAIHPNVARHHLDRLVAAGHVVTATAKHGVGRPAKTYAAAEGALPATGASRRDELLVALLERSVELLGPERAEAMALEVGESYGRRLAAERATSGATQSVRTAMSAVAAAFTAHGFAARTEVREGTLSVVAGTCPFGDAAAHHPVLCAVDRGLVLGMLAGLGALGTAPVTMSSRARGDDACRATA